MSKLQEQFKATMACYPAGVVVVTTIDSQGRFQGFTATSFCSLSLDPPSILVCLANSALCYRDFINSQHFVVHFVDALQVDTALTFARRGADKFGAVAVRKSSNGVPVLQNCVAFLECETGGHFVSGDHAILVGNVRSATLDHERDVLVHYRRKFGRVSL
jgi:flavin reductase ActVB